jgi:hypothetical protein
LIPSTLWLPLQCRHWLPHKRHSCPLRRGPGSTHQWLAALWGNSTHSCPPAASSSRTTRDVGANRPAQFGQPNNNLFKSQLTYRNCRASAYTTGVQSCGTAVTVCIRGGAIGAASAVGVHSTEAACTIHVNQPGTLSTTAEQHRRITGGTSPRRQALARSRNALQTGVSTVRASCARATWHKRSTIYICQQHAVLSTLISPSSNV